MDAITCLGDWTPNNASLTDQENRFSDHFVFLRPIASAARVGNVEMVMSLLACDRTDVNKGASSLVLESRILKWSKSFLKSKKEVHVNAVKYLPLRVMVVV